MPTLIAIIQAEYQHDPVPVKINEVVRDVVNVDGNHELTRQRLHFKVSIEEVCEAIETGISIFASIWSNHHVCHPGKDH